MRSIKTTCHHICQLFLLLLLFILTGCNQLSQIAQVTAPRFSAVHHFTLSAQQGLRDLAGDFTVSKGGADTGIALSPDERVEVFASGSARVKPDGSQSGPEGATACREVSMPQPALPCYAVVYSIGVTGTTGVVGQHTSFVATREGDLFLGINSPNLTRNAGSFQITVVAVPSETVAGIWNTPNNEFSMQGTFITLSVYAFAQDNAINNVQFTASWPGQNTISICDDTIPEGTVYTCRWRLNANNSYLHNGSVTFGFILQPTRGSVVKNPDGERSGLLRYVITQPNENYAGYSATDLNQGTTRYNSVSARWIVPDVQCAPAENSSAAMWVGMTGNSSRSVLAQIATLSSCNAGIPQFEADWELFPAPAIRMSQPVSPGDTVTATVAFQNGNFQLVMNDPRENWQFTITQPGSASDTSIAECIVEAPTEAGPAQNSFVAPLANFGSVNIFCQANGSSIGQGPQNMIFQMESGGVSKATTSKLDRQGSTFVVQWQHS